MEKMETMDNPKIKTWTW